jgi:hypothetical protein
MLVRSRKAQVLQADFTHDLSFEVWGWKGEELVENTILQPRYFRLVLGLVDNLRKYFCTPTKTIKLVPSLVRSPADYF